MRTTLRAPFLPVLLVLVVLAAACGSGDGTVDAGADPPAEEAPDDETPDDEISDGDADDEVSVDVDDGTPPDPIDLDLLQSGTWTLWIGGGPSGDVPIVDGWPITITFGPDTYGGTAACNGYGGPYRIQGQRLIIDEMSVTSAGCAAGVQASEEAFIEAMLDVEEIVLLEDGGRGGPELILAGVSTELLFSLSPAAPIDDLVGRFWLLEALLQDGEETAPAGEPAILRLEADGSLSGSTGCRALAGRYVVGGNEILFTDFGADGDCPGSLFDQDSRVVTVLGDGFVPELDGDTLVLTSSGNEGLRYRAVSEDELNAVEAVPVESDAEALAGVEWRFVGGDSPGGLLVDPTTIDETAEITLVFEDGTYGGSAVCNRYSGSAEIGDGGRLTLGAPVSTRASCGPDLDVLAAVYLDALDGLVEFGVEADGTRLVMNDGDGVELAFERVG